MSAIAKNSLISLIANKIDGLPGGKGIGSAIAYFGIAAVLAFRE
jgi:hypothetical protein